MPIDTSIPLSVRPFQLEDPNVAKAKQLQLKSLMMQSQQAEQAQAESQQLADAYRSSTGAGGQLDRTQLTRNLAQGGLGARIPGLQKQFAESDEATAKVDAQKFDIAKKRLDASSAALSSLASMGDRVTHDDVIGTVAGMVQQGLMDQDQGAALVRSLPGRPEALRPYLVQKGLQVMDAAKRMELIAPKFQLVNTGKQQVPVDMNPYTNPSGPQPLSMTTTPGEDLSANTTRRGQDISASTAIRGQNMSASTAAADRQQRTAAAASVIEKDAGGNLTIIDKATGQARPVTGIDGKPINLGAGQADAKEALKLIDQALPLLKSSTGSWSGKGLDVLAGTFGMATDGSVSASKLRAIEGALVAKMPKMSGPQSDADVAMYRQMAGQIGDDTVPYQRKLAALDTIREIQERYAGMAPGASRPAPGPAAPARNPMSAPRSPAPPAPGGVVDWSSL